MLFGRVTLLGEFMKDWDAHSAYLNFNVICLRLCASGMTEQCRINSMLLAELAHMCELACQSINLCVFLLCYMLASRAGEWPANTCTHSGCHRTSGVKVMCLMATG